MVRVNILMFNHTRDANLPRALKKNIGQFKYKD